MSGTSPTMTLEVLEQRLRTMLPEEYRDVYEEVQPVSMGSAGLKFGADGKVAWNEMWATFCDLAMAGGPPHRGTLLQPASPESIQAEPTLSQQVTDEICRGLSLVSGLAAVPSPATGWISVTCNTWGMAEWLVRAIALENVSVRRGQGITIELPTGPAYRLEKEIKNVITSLAKTSHYWFGHMAATHRWAIANQ